MDPSALLGAELWNKVAGMWAFKGRTLSIHERKALGRKLHAMKESGEDIERCAQKTLQCGWRKIFTESELESFKKGFRRGGGDVPIHVSEIRLIDPQTVREPEAKKTEFPRLQTQRP
jgi:hypothetical protein